MVNPVLISVNARFSHTNLALLYLKKALDDACRMIEWDINRSRQGLLEILMEDDFSHYFFSAYIWNSEYLKSLITDLSALRPDAIICCGGPEAVYNSRVWLKVPGLSYILDGNAEDFAEIIPSLRQKETAEIIRVQQRPFAKTIFPYDEELLNDLVGRLIYYEASRGCPFNCSYCLSAVQRKEPDYRTEDQIREEINLLSRFKGTVKFVDRTFNYNKKISRFIWQLMTENPPEGCFHFEIYPALLEDEDIRLLSLVPPGKAQLEIGIQSTNQQILKNIKRADNWESSMEKIGRLIEIDGLRIHLDQIIGLPGDNPETAAETMNKILDLHPEVFQPGFLKLLPGTPLAENADRYEIKASSLPPYEILESESFSFLDLRHFHQFEDLVSILWNSGYFRLTLIYLAEKAAGWTTLFEALLNGTGNEGPATTETRRWEHWGLRILNMARAALPDEQTYIIDLLRLDWCRFANSQRYPDFIEYSDVPVMNALKKEACKTAAEKFPEFTKSELKRSILFVPESKGEHPELTRTLFIRHRKEIIQIPEI